MEPKKIDLTGNIHKGELTARLYILCANFKRNYFKTKEDENIYCKGLILENFLIGSYPLEIVTTHLCAFFYGLESSQFSKLIK